MTYRPYVYTKKYNKYIVDAVGWEVWWWILLMMTNPWQRWSGPLSLSLSHYVSLSIFRYFLTNSFLIGPAIRSTVLSTHCTVFVYCTVACTHQLGVLVTEQTIQCTVQCTYISIFILITRYVSCRFSDWRLMFQKIRNSGCTDVQSSHVTSSDIRTSHYTRRLGTFLSC